MTMRWSPMVFSIPHELGCRAVPSTGHRQQAGVGRIDLERRLYLQVDRSALAFVPPPHPRQHHHTRVLRFDELLGRPAEAATALRTASISRPSALQVTAPRIVFFSSSTPHSPSRCSSKNSQCGLDRSASASNAG